jgi:hypothetical protein
VVNIVVLHNIVVDIVPTASWPHHAYFYDGL